MCSDSSRKERIKYFIFFLIVLNIVIPLLIVGLQGNTQSNVDENYYYDKIPKTHSFYKGKYEPILDTEKQGLGDINITDLFLSPPERGISLSKGMSTSYKEDLSSGALKVSYNETKFIKTKKIAQVDNINENITEYRKITVLLNETIDVSYNASIQNLEGYLLYAPKLTPFLVVQLWIENDTYTLRKVNEQYYSIVTYDDINFLKYNYRDNFTDNTLNFTLHIIWEYNLTINSWKLTQYEVEDLLIEEENQDLSPEFKYEFNLIGKKFNGTQNAVINAKTLEVNLTVNFPDKALLRNHKLKINSETIVGNFLNPDGSLSKEVLANNTKFLLDFTVNYTIGFVEPVDETWGIDRLVEDKDIRERIYFPRIISGPNHIFVKYVNFFEDTIGFEQVKSESSLFGRDISYIEVNVTKLEEDIKNSLIFSENATKRQGIKITLPYLIKGEVCPFTFKYETDKDLRVIITDNIRMPIVGLDVVVYYYGEKYGTYISKEVNQPIGPTITDQNGEILVENVPNGNYTIRIYDPITEELIMEAEVSAFTEVNYVITPIVHFPLIFLIFSIGSVCVFGIGFIIFKKQKTRK